MAADSQHDLLRFMTEQQLNIATATERVQERQIRLLLTQREIIDDQLAEATRKRDNATREILNAGDILADLTGPMIVDSLDPSDPAHRKRTWRGQAGEIWRWIVDQDIGLDGAFLWTRNHPAASQVPGADNIGAPFTEVVE